MYFENNVSILKNSQENSIILEYYIKRSKKSS